MSDTCWDLIQDAASGDGPARMEFSSRYLPVVRAYLGARWRDSLLAADLEDAVQEVFLECFRDGGVLDRVDKPSEDGGSARSSFRAYLFGAVRNVALRVEARRAALDKRRSPETFHASEVPANETELSQVFDRAWARSIMRHAGELQAARAARNNDMRRRVEILRLRFHEGMPIRDIASLWGELPDKLHREYEKARREFREALREVVGLHQKCSRARLEAECDRLLALLGAPSSSR